MQSIDKFGADQENMVKRATFDRCLKAIGIDTANLAAIWRHQLCYDLVSERINAKVLCEISRYWRLHTFDISFKNRFVQRIRELIVRDLATIKRPEAFEEAVAKTAGLPWKKLGVVKADPKQFVEVAAEPEPEPVVVEEYVYKDLVDAFTDDSGKFSYALFNKSLIQLAHRSPVVKRMLAEGAGVAEIRDYVVGAKVRGITKNDRLSADEVAAIVAVLDALEPKGVLKELNAELRRMQAKAK